MRIVPVLGSLLSTEVLFHITYVRADEGRPKRRDSKRPPG